VAVELTGRPVAAPTEPATAAVLLIGDELLTGKVRDENGFFLAQMLRRRGIRLLQLAIVGDRQAEIVEALLRLGRDADLLFTTGGVGPTHDDVTLDAVAKAAGVPLSRNARMEALLRRHYGPEITNDALRMADIPEGTQLRADEGWPVLRLDLDRPAVRVYMLPGVPWLLRTKIDELEALEDELPLGEGWHLTTLHTDLEESRLAPFLDLVAADFPDVAIGSYPRWNPRPDGRPEYQVRVTLEAPKRSAARADAARASLADRLPSTSLLNPS